MKKLLWIVGAYIAGSTINSAFSKKDPQTVQDEVSNASTNKEAVSRLWKNFKETQSNFFDTVLVRMFGKKKSKDIQNNIESQISNFKGAAEDYLASVKDKGFGNFEGVKAKIEEYYNQFFGKVEDASEEIKSKAKQAKAEIEEKIEKATK